jgi:hypothetical protein
MTNTFTYEINTPLDKVVQLYSNYDNHKNWQKELVSWEPVSGPHLQKGSKTRLVYRSVTMIETIIANNLPHSITSEYDHLHGKNIVMRHRSTHRFSAIGAAKTRFETEMEFIEAFGFMPKLMMKLMGGMFRKFYDAQLKRFGEYAESVK